MGLPQNIELECALYQMAIEQLWTNTDDNLPRTCGKFIALLTNIAPHSCRQNHMLYRIKWQHSILEWEPTDDHHTTVPSYKNTWLTKRLKINTERIAHTFQGVNAFSLCFPIIVKFLHIVIEMRGWTFHIVAVHYKLLIKVYKNSDDGACSEHLFSTITACNYGRSLTSNSDEVK